MSIEAEFSVLLPTDCYEQIVAICKRNNWSHREMMYCLINLSPPAGGRTTPRPPPTRKADCPHRFTAPLDAYYQKRVETICSWSGWSRRDMVINLLDIYLEKLNHE